MALPEGLIDGLFAGFTGSLSKTGLSGILTPAELIFHMGHNKEPTNMWLFDGVGGAHSLAGGKELTASGSPNLEQELPAFDRKMVGFDEGSATQKCVAGDNTVCDPGNATSFSFLWVGDWQTDGVSARNLVGKREGSGSFLGWEYNRRGDTNQLRFVLDGTTTTSTRTVSNSVGSAVVLGVLDIPGPSSALHTPGGTATSATVLFGDMTAALSTLAAGDGDLRSAAEQHTGLLAFWAGAGAWGMDDTHRTNLSEYLGLE